MNTVEDNRMHQDRSGAVHTHADLQAILESVQTIAVVGASANPLKASYGVVHALSRAGYDVIPVNPRPDVVEIQGLPVYPCLQCIDRSVDMVDVFRPSGELADIARQAVAIRARVLWAQLGIHDDEAARLAEAGGLQVVMDRCPKIELARSPAESGALRET